MGRSGGINMAGKYGVLTKYIGKISNDNIGEWFIDKANDGTMDHPIQMPYVNYSDLVCDFMEDVYKFTENNQDTGLNDYHKILEEHGIAWEMEAMETADVSELDARCVMALIVGAVRAERFCDGALLEFFKKGTIHKWLLRLEELDK
jgi:hypothetical protein